MSNTVVVYAFEKYSISEDGYKKSERMGTEDAIKRLGGRVIPGSEIKAPESDVNRDGLTEKGYSPCI